MSFKLLISRPESQKGMTLSEKILVVNDVERRGEVKPGDMIRVNVDWIMASELFWSVGNLCIPGFSLLILYQGMKSQYDSLDKPAHFEIIDSDLQVTTSWILALSTLHS
jgi:hypothetical protein